MPRVLDDLFNQRNLHHAYLLVGQPGVILPILETAIKNRLEVDDLSSNPDYWQERFLTFGIKESLDLRGRQTKKAFGETGRYFVLTIDSITVEAQNALLKTFEEPASDVHFFMIARSEDIFLPTLKSRLEIIDVKHSVLPTEVDEKIKIEKFLKLEPQARLDFMQKEFVKKPARSSGEKEIGRGEIFDFLGELEMALHKKVKKISGADKELIFALEEIAKARGYLSNPRSSVRLILEHLAMVVSSQ